jgi:hypothetical protein
MQLPCRGLELALANLQSDACIGSCWAVLQATVVAGRTLRDATIAYSRAMGFGYCRDQRTCSDAIDVSSESFSLGVIVTCGAAFKRRTLLFTKHSLTPPTTAACLLHRRRLHWRGWRDDGWHGGSCAGSWHSVSWHGGS